MIRFFFTSQITQYIFRPYPHPPLSLCKLHIVRFLLLRKNNFPDPFPPPTPSHCASQKQNNPKRKQFFLSTHTLLRRLCLLFFVSVRISLKNIKISKIIFFRKNQWCKGTKSYSLKFCTICLLYFWSDKV